MHINEMDLILPSTTMCGALWLGNYKAAQNIMKLDKENIRTVITVANNVNITYPKHQNMRHKIYKVQDKENVTIQELIEMTNEEIQEGLRYGSVLVHCMAGISRSATCIIAYLMITYSWKFEKALQYVKQRRPCANPNIGFKKQLIQYSDEIQKKIQLDNTTSIDDTLSRLRRRLYKSPEEMITSTKLAKSPKHQINLNKNSTEEEKQIYRQQLTQRLFVNTFQTERITPKKSLPNKSPTIKGFISMYKQIDENGMGFLSDRFAQNQ